MHFSWESSDIYFVYYANSVFTVEKTMKIGLLSSNNEKLQFLWELEQFNFISVKELFISLWLIAKKHNIIILFIYIILYLKFNDFQLYQSFL